MLKRILRFFYWGWMLKDSYDFDAQTIYQMLYLKLERMERSFTSNGHCVWNSDPNNKGMRKLRVAKNLAKRLWEEDDKTEQDEINRLDLKWGERDREFIPTKNGLNRFIIKNKNTKSEEEQLKADKEYFSIYEKSSKKMEYEKKQLFKLLSKHINYWWD